MSFKTKQAFNKKRKNPMKGIDESIIRQNGIHNISDERRLSNQSCKILLTINTLNINALGKNIGL